MAASAGEYRREVHPAGDGHRHRAARPIALRDVADLRPDHAVPELPEIVHAPAVPSPVGRQPTAVRITHAEPREHDATGDGDRGSAAWAGGLAAYRGAVALIRCWICTDAELAEPVIAPAVCRSTRGETADMPRARPDRCELEAAGDREGRPAARATIDAPRQVRRVSADAQRAGGIVAPAVGGASRIVGAHQPPIRRERRKGVTADDSHGVVAAGVTAFGAAASVGTGRASPERAVDIVAPAVRSAAGS